MTDKLLMIPGPTVLPAEVRVALGRPSIYHRGDDFAALLAECVDGLKTLLGTAQMPVLLTCSGTGGVEAMIVNTLSPGDRVLAVNSGKFGERMGRIAAAYGAAVTTIDLEPGRAADPEEIEEALAQEAYAALLLVYNETSTGVKQPLRELARIARERGVMPLVDCVSAIAGMPLALDEWGLAATAGGSQKALMLPPGLAVVALGDEGLSAAATAKMPKFYFDVLKAIAAQEKGQTPYTPNVSLILALQAALRLIFAEGLAAFQERHRRLARACRAAARAAGLELLVSAESVASDVVTAIKAPAGTDSGLLVKAVAANHDIVISGGQDLLKGKIFRIGHMGAVQLTDLLRTWEAVAIELNALGVPCEAEVCLSAAEAAYQAAE